MEKLSFLAGKWEGEARVFRGGETAELNQTEEAQYKLDGLLLLIEGVGRRRGNDEVALQALGLISYDDEKRTYQMRAFNDGRLLETEAQLLQGGNGLAWGFTLGEIKTQSVLRINEQREWTEVHEITIGSQSPKQFMRVRVRRVE